MYVFSRLQRNLEAIAIHYFFSPMKTRVLNQMGSSIFLSSFSSDDSNGSSNTPKMLCFGDYAKQHDEKLALDNEDYGSETIQIHMHGPVSPYSRKNMNRKRRGLRNQNPGEYAGARRRSEEQKKV